MELINILGFLLIIAFVGLSFLLGSYLFMGFAHEHEKEFTGLLTSKILVITGIACVFIPVFMLLMDILTIQVTTLTRRYYPFHFTFNDVLMWQILTGIMIVLVFVNFFFFFYYEDANLEDNSTSIKKSSIYVSIFVILFLSASIGIYFGLNKVIYRVDGIWNNIRMNSDVSDSISIYDGEVQTDKIEMHGCLYIVTTFFLPFVILSSLSFGLFGGAGMSFLPLLFIDKYMYRPRLMTAEEYVIAKKVLINESEEVIRKAKTAYEYERDLAMINPKEVEKIRMKKEQLAIQKQISKKAFIEFEEMEETFRQDEQIDQHSPLTDYLNLIIGVIFLIVSITFLVHTFLSINNVVGPIELILISVESLSWLVAMILVALFMGYGILSSFEGSRRIFNILSPALGTSPVLPKRTYISTFLLHINCCIFAVFGMILFFDRHCPRYMRYLGFDSFFNRIVVKVYGVAYIYRFKITEYLFILGFLISMFISFFVSNGVFMLRQKVDNKLKEIEAEKEKIAKIEKDQNNRLMIL